MKTIRNNLSVAACTLLSQNVLAAEAIDNAWRIDSSLLYYSEADDRVEVTKVIATARGEISDTDTAGIKIIFDTMSGATPSGAVSQSTVTFTVASGGGGGAGAAGSLSKFNDTRAAFSLDWKHKHSRTFDISYTGAFSVENDYRSFSAAATMNKETASKAYKFSLGIAGTIDQIFRTGGNDTPVPLSRVEASQSFGEGERDTTDIIAGVTHVINRRTIVQLNLAYGLSNGYHTDAYKVFSITVDGIEQDQFYESRPDSRQRTSITMNMNHQLYPGNDVIHASYRYYTDDWEIDSHTFTLSHQFKFSKGQFVEPNIRLYSQTQASFYQNAFVRSPTETLTTVSLLPQYISADYRLDEMTSIAIGTTYGKATSADGKFRARFAYILQSFENAEFDELKALVLQLSFGKRF